MIQPAVFMATQFQFRGQDHRKTQKFFRVVFSTLGICRAEMVKSIAIQRGLTPSTFAIEQLRQALAISNLNKITTEPRLIIVRKIASTLCLESLVVESKMKLKLEVYTIYHVMESRKWHDHIKSSFGAPVASNVSPDTGEHYKRLPTIRSY